MKLKYKFQIEERADSHVGVTVEESATQYSNILFLNSTGKFIMENLKEEISMDELVYRVCQHYEGDVGAIKSEVHKFICKLTELNLLS